MTILTAPFDEDDDAGKQAGLLLRHIRRRYNYQVIFMGDGTDPGTADVVHIRLSNAVNSQATMEFALKHQLPTVVSADGYFNDRKNWWQRAWDFNRKFSFNFASALVFSADGEFANTKEVKGVRPWVIHPGFECDGPNDHTLPAQRSIAEFDDDAPDAKIFGLSASYFNFDAVHSLLNKTPVLLHKKDTLADFVIRKNCGLVYEQNSGEAEEKFARLLPEARAEMGLSGYLAARKLFNIKNTGHLYNELYHHVISVHGK